MTETLQKYIARLLAVSKLGKGIIVQCKPGYLTLMHPTYKMYPLSFGCQCVLPTMEQQIKWQ